MSRIVRSPAHMHWNALWTDSSPNPLCVHVKLQRIELVHVKVSYDYAAAVKFIKSCGRKKCISVIRKLYAHKDRIVHDIIIANTLIRSFARCGALREAREVFEQITNPDVVSWNALIAGYADQGFGHEALTCFREMQKSKVAPDSVTYICALKACAIIGAVGMVKQIHAQVRQKSLPRKGMILESTLISAYARCGAVKEALDVFEQLTEPDVVSWTALIAGYADQGFGGEALTCYKKMQSSRVKPDSVTYICALKACAIVGAVETVENIHIQVRQDALLSKNIVLCNTLINAYARCGEMKKARELFEQITEPNIVSWNALISGYVEQRLGEDALACFRKIQQKKMSPDSVTFICALKACSLMGAVEVIKEIHGLVRRKALLNEDMALRSTLVDAYAKCGAVKEAREIFDQFNETDVVSWTTLIYGYVEQGFSEEAIMLFREMQRRNVTPDSVAYTCALKACAIVGAVEIVESIHVSVREQAFLEKDVSLGSALVDSYAAGGAIKKAQEVFDQLAKHDIVSWTALIAGHARVGSVDEMLVLFNRMMSTGISPSPVTFIVLLNGCSHGALLEEGLWLFTMIRLHGFSWTSEHQTCMVDLFGRAGRFDNAKQFVLENRSTLLAFLGACGKWVEVGHGRWAFEKLLRLDRNCASAHVCMSNLYAATCMIKDAENRTLI